MIETIKEITCETIDKWDKQGEIDIVGETANMMMQNILSCIFGRAHENPEVEYTSNGETKRILLG